MPSCHTISGGGMVAPTGLVVLARAAYAGHRRATGTGVRLALLAAPDLALDPEGEPRAFAVLPIALSRIEDAEWRHAVVLGEGGGRRAALDDVEQIGQLLVEEKRFQVEARIHV